MRTLAHPGTLPITDSCRVEVKGPNDIDLEASEVEVTAPASLTPLQRKLQAMGSGRSLLTQAKPGIK